MAKYIKSEQTFHNIEIDKDDIEQLKRGDTLRVNVDGGAIRISVQGENATELPKMGHCKCR